MAGVAWNHPSGGISGHTFDDLVELGGIAGKNINI